MLSTNEYKIFDDAYKFFNEKLFNNNLPECLITFQRHPKYNGYFQFECICNRENPDNRISEIAMNINYFLDRTDFEILQTFVHELCHVAQFYLGNRPEKLGWHDSEFAEIMEKVGLIVSTTGLPGGRKFGKKMSDYFIPNGKFEKYCKEFLENNKINWQNVRIPENTKQTRNRKSKLKYKCPDCEKSVSSKDEIKVKCMKCDQEMEEQVL